MSTPAAITPKTPSTTPPKPAAPAPKPNASPAPEPKPTPTPPTPPPADKPKSFFESLDAETFTTPDKPPVKPDAAPADKAPDAPVVDDKDKPADSRQFTTPKALRDAHERATKENKTLSEKISTLEKQITDYEAKGKETTSLTSRLTALEKEKDTLAAELSLARFSTSPEFEKNHVKPFNDSADFAKRTIESLDITEPATQEGAEPTVRPAKWEDFVELYRMPINKAARLARAVFGDNAQTVINHLNELQRLDFNKQKAFDEERGQWQSKKDSQKAEEDAKIAREAGEKEAIQKMWAEYNRDIADREPEYFQGDPKDPKEKELLTKGFNLVDSSHNRGALTLQQQVLLDAQIRNRAAAHTLMRYKLTKATERIAELEAKVKEMENGGPDAGDLTRPGGGQQPDKEKGFMEEADEVLNAMR